MEVLRSFDELHFYSNFNPLPSFKKGETSKGLISLRLSNSFNPLPSFKKGETIRVKTNTIIHRVSIHSLRLRREKPYKLVIYKPISGVSIHSLRLRREKRCRVDTQNDRIRGFNPLPSFKKGETPDSLVYTAGIQGFNPLPSFKKGETFRAFDDAGKPKGFNPLPSFKKGETSACA